VPIKPYFSKANSVLYENDGVYALANLRGGSEYGQAWHEAGMLQNKQNVFDGISFGGSLNLQNLIGMNLSVDLASLQAGAFGTNNVITLRMGL